MLFSEKRLKKKIIIIAERIIKRGYAEEITEQIKEFLVYFKSNNDITLQERKVIKRLLLDIEKACNEGNYDRAKNRCKKLTPREAGDGDKPAEPEEEDIQKLEDEYWSQIEKLEDERHSLLEQLRKDRNNASLARKIVILDKEIEYCRSKRYHLTEMQLKSNSRRDDYMECAEYMVSRESSDMFFSMKRKRNDISEEEVPSMAILMGQDGEKSREPENLTIDKVNFSAVAPKAFDKEEFAPVNVIMYEEAYRGEVDKIIAQSDAPVNEFSSGIHEVERNSEITVALTSSDGIEIDESIIKQIWKGKYLNFTFMVCVPEDYGKKQILFTATIYINAVIATKLKFTARCQAESKQKLELVRSDIKSAFMSYSSEDIHRVASILQGIKTARPDLDVFFDVESLRRGEHWEERLYKEVDSRDVLYLCWSRNAGASVWVDREWRRAYAKGGEEKIEPIPIEPPNVCPPPEKLNRKHFNDKMLYYAYELKLNQ